MISHTIIKHKPKVTIANVREGGGPWWHDANPPKTIIDQASLDSYLESTPPEGCLVVAAGTGVIASVYVINKVIAVQNDYKNFIYDVYNCPETHYILQAQPVYNEFVSSWGRWAPGKMYRSLTPEEIARWVDDNIQDNFQKAIARRKEQGKTP